MLARTPRTPRSPWRLSPSLSLLNSFQYLQRNECVIIPSRHDPILPPHPLSPLFLCFSPCPTQSSLSHLPYLFIYLLSCLFIVLPLIAFVVSWPRDVASIFDFTFAFRIRPLSFMGKNWNWFYSICNATFHHALFMLLHFTGYAEERPPSQGSPFAAFRLPKSLWLLHRFMVLCLNDCLFWHTVATGRGGVHKKYHIESKSDNQVINLNWNS